MVFDCLYHRGQDFRARPLTTRRNVLEDVLDDQDLVLPVRRLADNGLKAWQQVLERGYEGLVAKDPASPYVGGRTLKWLKVKQREYRVEKNALVLTGNSISAGSREARQVSMTTPPLGRDRPVGRVDEALGRWCYERSWEAR